MRVVFFFSILKTVWPADADKIANLAQHPKCLGTAALNDEALATLRQNAGVQCLAMGPVSIGNHRSRVAGLVKSDPVASETMRGLNSAISKGITLPKRNSPTFDGKPLHYGYMKSFEETVMNQNSDTASQLEYLIDMCRDKAYEAIRSCNIVNPPSEALKGALDKLASKFGKTHVVVMAHLDSITKGSPIKADEESMVKLANDMANCCNKLVHWGYLSELNSSQTLLYVLKRLPTHLQRKFCDIVDIVSIGYAAAFSQLSPFVVISTS